jgi:hypothetical protein
MHESFLVESSSVMKFNPDFGDYDGQAAFP